MHGCPHRNDRGAELSGDAGCGAPPVDEKNRISAVHGGSTYPQPRGPGTRSIRTGKTHGIQRKRSVRLGAAERPFIDVSIVAAVDDAASFRSVVQPLVIVARDLQLRGMRIEKIAGAIPGNDPGITRTASDSRRRVCRYRYQCSPRTRGKWGESPPNFLRREPPWRYCHLTDRICVPTPLGDFD